MKSFKQEFDEAGSPRAAAGESARVSIDCYEPADLETEGLWLVCRKHGAFVASEVPVFSCFVAADREESLRYDMQTTVAVLTRGTEREAYYTANYRAFKSLASLQKERERHLTLIAQHEEDRDEAQSRADEKLRKRDAAIAQHTKVRDEYLERMTAAQGQTENPDLPEWLQERCDGVQAGIESLQNERVGVVNNLAENEYKEVARYNGWIAEIRERLDENAVWLARKTPSPQAPQVAPDLT
jgi:hypothetical protein